MGRHTLTEEEFRSLQKILVKKGIPVEERMVRMVWMSEKAWDEVKGMLTRPYIRVVGVESETH